MRAKIIATGIGTALLLAATPALARHHERMDYPVYPGGYPDAYAPPIQAAFPVDRALAERCGLHAGSVHPYQVPAGYYQGEGRHRGDRLGGLLIGGVAGGLIGNRVAGSDDRVLGTAAGAAIGAIAGSAIDRGVDSRRYDDRVVPPPGEGYSQGYAGECDAVLPAGYMLVSVPGGQECRDEVEAHEDWVPENVTVPGRIIYERAPPRDKRTKLRWVK